MFTAGGCGFFDVDNPPDPLWGIWMGPYPTTLSTNADSARWTFAPNGIYLFYALNSEGTILHREEGFFQNSGIQLILSADRAGNVDTYEMLYELRSGELLLTIEGGLFNYRRVGTAEQAEEFEDTPRKPAGALP